MTKFHCKNFVGSAILVFTTSLLFALPQSGFAQAEKSYPPALSLEEAPREVRNAVSFRAHVKKNLLRSDLDGRTEGHVLIELNFETKGKFHLYEDKMDFWTEVDSFGQRWQTSVLDQPEVYQFLDPVSKGMKPGYRGEDSFKLELRLSEAIASALPLTHKIPLVVAFQACSDKICLLPTQLKIEVPLLDRASNETSASSWDFTAQAQSFLESNLGSNGPGALTYLILLAAGLITAFTPCVYPLYPITLGIFSRWGQALHVSPFVLALFYSAGLTLSYAALGLVSAASGTVFGALTQTPLFLITVGLLILFSALIFSGLIHFQWLDRLQNLFQASPTPVADSEGQKKTAGTKVYAQAAGMGASLGLVASPCVGPVLVVLLAWLSTQLGDAGAGRYLEGFALFASFGLGMSIPFLVLGHLIIRMRKTPKLGRFTPYFKYLGTALMVIAALFFLIPGFQLLTRSGESVAKNFHVYSLSDWPKDRPTVIDFRADWCAACIDLENHTFVAPSVSKFFEDETWHFVQVDLTEMTPENQKIAQDYQIVGLPTVIITNANGEPCQNLKLFGFEGPQEFYERMQRAQTECPPPPQN